MFNFNFNLQAIADWWDSGAAVQLEKELASLASVATAAAVASPAVVDSAADIPPSKAEVQKVVTQVVQAVAPVVAPSVPPRVISKLEQIIPDEVVDNPQVKASAAGATVTPAVVNKIASSVSSTFKTDAQKDVELREEIKKVTAEPTTAKPSTITQPGTTATTTAKPDAVNMPFDTTKPATKKNMPFDTTETPRTANLVDAPATTATTAGAATVTATATAAANVTNKVAQAQAAVDAAQAKVNSLKGKGDVSGTVAASKELSAAQKELDAAKRGIDTAGKTRQDVVGEIAKQNVVAERTAAAEADPMKNPTIRPQGTIDSKNGFIVYYSWVGDQWRSYRADLTPDNMAKYGSRVVGGETQGSFESSVGANALQSQPMPVRDDKGTITGWTASSTTGGTKVTTSGITTSVTTGGVTTGVTTGGVTTGVTTGGVTTGVTTGGVTTGVVTGGVTTGTTTSGTTTRPTTTTTTTPVTFDNLSAERRGIFDVLTDRFRKYGLESLVPRIRELIINGATEDTITIMLQESPEYQRRFRANQDRISKGLSVLTPVEYLNAEDAYRQILRAYGLNQFDNDAYVSQFISNDISAAELSSRVVNAVQRVRNADPAISKTLRDFYGIGQNDLVAYVLDPNQQLPKIERQIAAAEIGTAARRQGIETGVGVAEQLAAQGITQAEAQKGYATIADILPTAEKLSQIYGGVEEAYDLAQAEQEVFNTLASAQRRRQRLTQRELASFSGQTGLGRTSLTQQGGGQF